MKKEKNIILLGQDQELTRLTGRILKRKGYEVRCFTQFQNALQALQEESFKLMIAEVETEALKEQFCQKVKKTDPNISLLILSGSHDDEVSALNAGADDWMKQPCKMEVLQARIATLLRQTT